MEQGKLVVLGSINADHVLNIEHFPQPGETVSGQHYRIDFGGKGANQAVAAGRSGAEVTFLACVGQDEIGGRIVQQLAQDNINTVAIESIAGKSTGVALIFVNPQGENIIGISAGANAAVTPEYLLRHQERITEADVLLMQLESPLETIIAAANLAKQHDVQVILNPAPARSLPDELLQHIDIITPNETEAEHLTAIKVTDEQSARAASAILHQKGVKTVLITLGRRGVWLSQHDQGAIIPGFSVKAVDTIAAGDTFNGAMITALLEGSSLKEAIRFAHAAAAISVTREGAQPSIPWRHEIATFLQQHPVAEADHHPQQSG